MNPTDHFEDVLDMVSIGSGARREIENVRMGKDDGMSFYSERAIKALRKPRQCQGCLHPMPVGSPALYCSGRWEGEFSTGHYHPDCRIAEMYWNNEIQHGFYTWCALNELETEQIDRLAHKFPDVAPLHEGNPIHG